MDDLPAMPVTGAPGACAAEAHTSYTLPASSPFDNFLKAAGC